MSQQGNAYFLCASGRYVLKGGGRKDSRDRDCDSCCASVGMGAGGAAGGEGGATEAAAERGAAGIAAAPAAVRRLWLLLLVPEATESESMAACTAPTLT